ncbi:hypothetical protein [Ralstonia mannitolilytica]|uniref:hypothetical protein n=1 Tax=Ralstonia mannitolilytica TaxID=105219 RepID=UPI0026ED84C5|nr:hypothetical protein [Ralstonia mannitolilytica]
MDEKQTTAMTTDIRALIADDGYAASFQSMGQYRTALLAALRAQDDAAPVAWITKEQLEQIEEWTADAWVYWRESGHVAEPDEVPLFLHPSLPAAQGLSDDEITQVWLDHGGSLNGNNFRSFARAILSRAATAGAGAENGSTAAQSQARSQSTLVPNGAATVAEPSEACRECNGAGKVDVTHSPLRDGYTETVRECCGTCGGTGKSEVSDGEREIREIWTTQAERENAQRTRMLDRFANRAATPATADFDLIAPNDAQAAQQQAEPESVIKRQAQKIGELIADRDSWIEAHARLYRLYHDQSPRAGEEIHVNVEGGDVYTLPLQLSGMDKPRFVVHVPCSPQAEPGADERAAFDEAECRAKCDVCPGTAATGGDWPCAKKAAKRAAQSGQQVGDAEVQRVLNRLNSSDPDFDDCAAAALGESK